MYNVNVDRLEQGTKNGHSTEYWKLKRKSREVTVSPGIEIMTALTKFACSISA